MNAVEIIERATVEGITLTLSLVGTITAIGDQATINRWLPLIRRQKPEIITELQREPGTSGTSQKTIPGTKCENPATQDEKLHELDLLIEYVAENNGFSDEDIIEAKSNAENDLENALVCFRELAADCRLVKVNAMLKANPGSLRALYTDTQSDLNNVILTVAIRGMAACEMHISKKKFDAFQLLALIEASEQQTH